MSYTAVFITHNDLDEPLTKIMMSGDVLTQTDLSEADILIQVFDTKEAAQDWIRDKGDAYLGTFTDRQS